ncbi:hypothetical protein [Marinimicrobium sp. C2-29]|uniref:hypothetical protein n=1 Tax=Marinimicrobium sp. C2-29 TaxID=3139825 RepID=UPI0031388811
MARFIFTGTLSLLTLSTLLVACGGEREEPFDPPEEPEEFRERVNSFVVYDNVIRDQSRPETDTDGKRLEVMDDSEDYDTLLNAYLIPGDFVNEPNFDEGQVVLYDGGWIDESGCEQQLDLRRIEAHYITEEEDLVEVTVTHRRIEADEDAVCNEAVLYRPFEFHYVESRADIVIVEQVQGLSEGSGGSSSSSSSSSSAN